MAATSVEKTSTELGAYFRHVARRNDRATAVFATARKLAQLIYRALHWGQAYVDHGAEAYEQSQQQARIRNLERRAAQMGYELVPKNASPAPA